MKQYLIMSNQGDWEQLDLVGIVGTSSTWSGIEGALDMEPGDLDKNFELYEDGVSELVKKHELSCLFILSNAARVHTIWTEKGCDEDEMPYVYIIYEQDL